MPDFEQSVPPGKTSQMNLAKGYLPIVLVASLLGGVGSAAGVAAVARDRLDQTVKDVERLKAEREELTIQSRELTLRLSIVEKNQDRTNAALDRIETRLGTK